MSYKRQLYVASPIAKYDWKKVVGLSRSPETEHWLPLVFYKADIARGRYNHFKVAGIEVVTDVNEAMRVKRRWDSLDTLPIIAKRFGMVVDHGPVHV